MPTDDTDENNGTAGSVETHSSTSLEKPKMFKVILINDHYTTMDFVIEVLMTIFHKSAAEATSLMLDVHKRGFGIAGVYTFDIALTKINEVHALAKEREFPLKCSHEED